MVTQNTVLVPQKWHHHFDWGIYIRMYVRNVQWCHKIPYWYHNWYHIVVHITLIWVFIVECMGEMYNSDTGKQKQKKITNICKGKVPNGFTQYK